MFTLASCAVFFFHYLSIKEVILSFGIVYISGIFDESNRTGRLKRNSHIGLACIRHHGLAILYFLYTFLLAI